MKRSSALLLSLLVFTTTLVLNLSRNHVGRHEKEEAERSGALQALDFWTRSRAYPETDIPSSAYFRAFQSARLAKEAPRSPNSAAVWKPIGPLNLQGRSI